MRLIPELCKRVEFCHQWGHLHSSCINLEFCLTLGKRWEIERLYNDDMRPSEIAAAVGVTTATIYRELKRGETGELDKHFRPAYSAEAVERAVRLSIRNRGRRKAEK